MSSDKPLEKKKIADTDSQEKDSAAFYIGWMPAAPKLFSVSRGNIC